MSTSTLIYGLATLGSGIMGLTVRYCFKSKCEDVNLCFGLIKIHRNTSDEIKEDQIEIQNNTPKKEDSIKNMSNIL